jgi:hypothetical protein
MSHRKFFFVLTVFVWLLSLLNQPLAQAKETDQDMSLAPVGGQAMVDPFTGSWPGTSRRDHNERRIS